MPAATAIRQLSTAAERRPAVVEAALRRFAQTGYGGTTTAEIAAAAGISQAYVFRLFGSKQDLFIAALEHCFSRVQAAVAGGAEQANSVDPAAVLDGMAVAYAQLLSDRDLLLMQVQAMAAANEAPIQQRLQACYARLTTFVLERSGASP
jgi:AcrR family transcriptional regulator